MATRNDESLKRLSKAFEFETNAELDRKRMVYLSHIVSQTRDEIQENAKDVDFNRLAYETRSKIVQKRQRAPMRRERLGELLQWVGLLGSFIGGVFASPYLKEILKASLRVGS